jgi:exopolysaccharide biosynthesis polyprenyl glycosylphosphotransferase
MNAWISIRARLRWLTVAVDAVLMLASFEVAFVVFSWFHHFQLTFTAGRFDWGIPLGIVSMGVTFLWLGLYKLEAFTSRPLHLTTLFKGSLIAMVITAFFAFMFKAPVIIDSRLTVLSAFAVFFVLDALVRIALVNRVYLADVRARPGGSLVVGVAAEGSVIASRCRELRGFAPVSTIEPLQRGRNGFDAEPALLEAIAAAQPAPRQVFLDGGSLGFKATFDLIAAARARGAEVYVTGRLVSPLDTTGILLHLFETPVMRVRQDPAVGEHVPAAKRAFDIVAATLALVLLAPAFAVIAILIKRDSPGPVFYRQPRIGLRGRPFDFVKFRSMLVDNDAAEHRDVSCRFITEGPAALSSLPCTDGYGRPLFKLPGGERVTGIGRWMRKYSVDELPQFWNVLKGDMSMVGPRPALGYEVESYKRWHRRRLEVAPGVSGLWQVAGRSRVGFDEMVFQDVIYSYNQSVLTDMSICLRTVPAVLMGRGAA